MSEATPGTKNPLDPSLFRAATFSEETSRFKKEIIKLFTPLPNWWEVGAQTVRDSRARDDGPFPFMLKSAGARTITYVNSVRSPVCESHPRLHFSLHMVRSAGAPWCARVVQFPAN
jgi:hypothetical protein